MEWSAKISEGCPTVDRRDNSKARRGFGGAGLGWAELTVEKRNQLLASALGAQGKGNSRKTVNSIESEEDVVVLVQGEGVRLVSETRDEQSSGEGVSSGCHRLTFNSSISTAIGYSSSLALVASAILTVGGRETAAQ